MSVINFDPLRWSPSEQCLVTLSIIVEAKVQFKSINHDKERKKLEQGKARFVWVINARLQRTDCVQKQLSI